MKKYRARILLVDDDESVREVLKIFLEEENYYVTDADDGKIATQLLKLDGYDLVISDVKMPNMGGIELLH